MDIVYDEIAYFDLRQNSVLGESLLSILAVLLPDLVRSARVCRCCVYWIWPDNKIHERRKSFNRLCTYDPIFQANSALMSERNDVGQCDVRLVTFTT